MVGPNGSGKSNVVDAIRWCLGEQSMRDLRGQRAEDVIHAGARRTLGAAEVSLTFEASAADRDSSPTALRVSRRLYRSGESDYLVNGKRVRLRDVQDTLRSIDIDGTRNIVVNQGMADALLAATPAERRVLLEQAAGLGSYRARREEARQKLHTTADNVATMQLVLAELEPRLRLLRRQSRALQERDSAREHLSAALTAWYASRWHEHADRLATLQTKFASIAATRRLAEEGLKDLERDTEQRLQAHRAWQLRVEAADAAFRSLRQEIDSAHDALRTAQHRLEVATRHEVELDTQCTNLSSRIDSAEKRLRDNEIGLNGLRQDLSIATARVAETQVESMERARVARDMERQSKAARERIVQLEAERNYAMRERETARHEYELLTNRRADATTRLRETECEIADAEQRKQMAVENSKHAAIAAGEAGTALNELQHQVSRLSARLERLRAILSSIRVRLTEAEKQVLAESRVAATLERDIGGTLLTHLQVSGPWSLAVASALGSWAAAGAITSQPTTWSDHDRARYLAWRDDISAHLPPDALWADSVADGLDPLWPSPLLGTVLVGADSQIADIWATLSTLPAHSVGAPALHVVSANGMVKTAAGTQTARQDDRAARYLRLKASSQRLTHRCAVLSTRFHRATAEEVRMHTEVVELHRAVQQAQREERAAEAELVATQSALRLAEREIQQLLSEHARASQQLLDLDVAEVESRRRVERAAGDLATHEQELTRVSNLATVDLQALSAAQEAARSSLDHAAQAEREHIGIASRKAEQERLNVSAQQELARLRTEHAEVTHAQPAAVQERLRAQEATDSATGRHQSLQVLRPEHENVLAQLRQEQPPAIELGSLAEPRQQLTVLVSAEERVAAAVRVATGERDALWIEIRRDLERDPSTLDAPVGPVPSPEDIQRLRSRASQYAEADASVVEECAELQERRDHLFTHVEDLTRAADELNSIIESADGEMRTRFATAFEAVSAEFARVFQVMLPGGTASLELLEPDGGVAVQAQLPGKRSRSSAAFSGGERALVASCLLFGVLTIRPTPFCVLDEVDAALDETNVDRYLSALRDITTRTQIIVVTHNRATMAAAEALYGLTMDRDGASTLLSLRLDTYQAVV